YRSAAAGRNRATRIRAAMAATRDDAARAAACVRAAGRGFIQEQIRARAAAQQREGAHKEKARHELRAQQAACRGSGLFFADFSAPRRTLMAQAVPNATPRSATLNPDAGPF